MFVHPEFVQMLSVKKFHFNIFNIVFSNIEFKNMTHSGEMMWDMEINNKA